MDTHTFSKHQIQINSFNQKIEKLFRQEDSTDTIKTCIDWIKFATQLLEEYSESNISLVVFSLSKLESFFHTILNNKKFDPFHVNVFGVYLANCLKNLASLYYEKGIYLEAKRYYKISLEIGSKVFGEKDINIASTLNNLAVVHQMIGSYKEAESCNRKALEIRRKALGEDHPDFAVSLNTLASLYQHMGDYKHAEEYYVKALSVRRKTLGEEHPDVGNSLNNLGNLYQLIGDYRKADTYYNKALHICQIFFEENHPNVAYILTNLASLSAFFGNYSEAEILEKKALYIFQNNLDKGHPIIAQVLNNLAVISFEKGDYLEAENQVKQAIDIRLKVLGEEHPDVATSLNNLALICSAKGDCTEARINYHKALLIFQKSCGKESFSCVILLSNLAWLSQHTGNLLESEKYCKEALEISSKILGENHPDFATVLNIIGLLKIRENKETAIESLIKATEIMDRVIGQFFSFSCEENRNLYIEKQKYSIYVCLSGILLSSKDMHSYACQGYDLILRRKSIKAEALASQQYALLSNSYPFLKTQFADLMSLRKQIGQRILIGHRAEDSHVYPRQLAELQQQKDNVEAELARQIPEMNLTRKLQAANHRAVTRTLPKCSSLIEFMYFDDYDFKAIPALGEQQWKSGRYLAFILQAGESDQIHLIDLGEAEPINHMIKNFRSFITRGKERDRSLTNFDQEAFLRFARPETPVSAPLVDNGHELRAKIFDPLLPAIGNCKRLFIAPDGDLSRLPFEVLPTDDGQRLIDHYTISYLSTGRDVLRFGAPSTGEPTPPIVAADPDFDLEGNAPIAEPSPGPEYSTSADDSNRSVSHSRISRDFDRGIHFGRLKGTRTEGERIAELLGVKPLLGAEVRETPLKACRSPQILHIATHGFFLENQKQDLNEDKLGAMGLMDISPEGSIGRLSAAHIENPLLRSGLALAGANTWLKDGTLPEDAEDAILTAEDVTAMDLLSTEMVVLSACETGLGEVQTGEGVFGLRRSFILAGAKTLVMSLWKVPDKQTQELMEDFYKRILAGQPRAEALRGAQLEMKKKYPDPLYWGAFICQGDPGPLKTYLYQHST